MKIYRNNHLIWFGENDSEELRQIAEFIASGQKYSMAFVSFSSDYKMLDKDETSVKSLENARKIGLKAGLKRSILHHKWLWCGFIWGMFDA